MDGCNICVPVTPGTLWFSYSFLLGGVNHRENFVNSVKSRRETLTPQTKHRPLSILSSSVGGDGHGGLRQSAIQESTANNKEPATALRRCVAASEEQAADTGTVSGG